MRHRGRVIGVHFHGPAVVVKVVELIVGRLYAPTLVEWARSFLKSTMEGGVCARTPWISRRSDPVRVLVEGLWHRRGRSRVARMTWIDHQIGPGPRLPLGGSLLAGDLIGQQKTSADVYDYLHDQTHDEKFRRPAALTEFVGSRQVRRNFGRDGVKIRERLPFPSSPFRDGQLKWLLDWVARRMIGSRNFKSHRESDCILLEMAPPVTVFRGSPWRLLIPLIDSRELDARRASRSHGS